MGSKRIVAFLLMLVMVASLCPVSAFAASDIYQLEVAGEVTVDGTVAQTVDVYFQSIAAQSTYSLEADWSLSETDGTNYLSLTSLTAPAGANATENSATTGKVYWTDNTFSAPVVTTAGGTVWTATYTVAANTPSGTYTVSLTGKATDSSYTTQDFGTLTAMIKVTNTSETTGETTGYSATIANASTSTPVRVGETLSIEVGANKDFYATQMKISYPTNLVTFVETEDAPYTITNNSSNGTLELAAYGDKKTTNDKFTLTFTATAAGNADFTITEAKFGNGEDAKSETLTAGTCPEALTVEIAKKQYSVTLNKVDNVAIFAGAETVLDGETYTFTPEAATGPYYDYTLPTATYADGTTATVTEMESGWFIANVTGDLTITGTRTPKTYNVTWSGDGAADMEDSAKVVTATYGINFEFTIPENIPAGTSDGYNYSATVSIEGNSDASASVNGKTYTIDGAEIIGNIIITVNKEIVDANKVTVNVSGGNSASSDITINNNSASSGSVTVEKNTDVVITVTPENGYDYALEINDKVAELDENNQYTIEGGISEETSIEVTKTVKVEGATSVKDNGDGTQSGYVTTQGNGVWLIKMPDHIKMQEENASKTKAYKYGNQEMYWSEKYDCYVITVFAATAPEIKASDFTIETVDATPAITYSYDVNKSQTIDANDAQLIWNMYNAWYKDFETVSREKFILADANGDSIVDVNDAVVIINDILNITANQT